MPNTTQEIIIAADADIAGLNAANKLITRLLESDYSVKIATPNTELRPTVGSTEFEPMTSRTKKDNPYIST